MSTCAGNGGLSPVYTAFSAKDNMAFTAFILSYLHVVIVFSTIIMKDSFDPTLQDLLIVVVLD